VTDILIADDQRFIRDMVRITLSTQGWTIAEAATPDRPDSMSASSSRKIRPRRRSRW